MSMLPFRSRSARRASEHEHEVAQIMALVGDFGETTHNPVKDRIAHLRELRNSGAMSAAEFAVEVSGLLGGSESAI